MTVWRNNPRLPMLHAEGRWWVAHESPEGWVALGFAPAPSTRWATFWHHVHHGRLMRYPWHRVLPWSWQHRHGFRDLRSRRRADRTEGTNDAEPMINPTTGPDFTWGEAIVLNDAEQHALSELCRALPAGTALYWLFRPHPQLDHCSPAHAILTGRSGEVSLLVDALANEGEEARP